MIGEGAPLFYALILNYVRIYDEITAACYRDGQLLEKSVA